MNSASGFAAPYAAASPAAKRAAEPGIQYDPGYVWYRAEDGKAYYLSDPSDPLSTPTATYLGYSQTTATIKGFIASGGVDDIRPWACYYFQTYPVPDDFYTAACDPFTVVGMELRGYIMGQNGLEEGVVEPDPDIEDDEAPPGSFVYIDESPTMPLTTARLIPPGVLDDDVCWDLKITFCRNRNDELTIGETLTACEPWDIPESCLDDYCGGLGHLEYAFCDISGEMYFHVRALNPSDNTVVSYINSNCGSHWYAQPIARHESYLATPPEPERYYNNFNPPGTSGQETVGPDMEEDIVYTPNRESGERPIYGWGIMQLTNPAPTRNQVWNWKKNIDGGISLLGIKRNTDSHFAKYPSHTTVGLPASVNCAGHTFTYSGAMSYHDLDTIKRYNGGLLFL